MGNFKPFSSGSLIAVLRSSPCTDPDENIHNSNPETTLELSPFSRRSRRHIFFVNRRRERLS